MIWVLLCFITTTEAFAPGSVHYRLRKQVTRVQFRVAPDLDEYVIYSSNQEGEQQNGENKPRHVPWPKIKSFSHVKREVDWFQSQAPVIYKAKVKLHGTNGGITIDKSGVRAQSRNYILYDGGQGLNGFRDWVKLHREKWTRVLRNLKDLQAIDDDDDTRMTVFGEWCGPGIHGGQCAVEKIPKLSFAVFGIVVQRQDDIASYYVLDPDEITNILQDDDDSFPADNVYVLPWYSPLEGSSPEELLVDFKQTSGSAPPLTDIVDRVNKLTADVDEVDPWVKTNFDIEGVGEGLVWFPLNMASVPTYMFKSKGEKHVVVKTKSATVDPATVAGVQAFVDLFVTENRLDQIAKDFNFLPTECGAFLKKFTADVIDESGPELEASGLTWKAVQKDVSRAAGNWFINKCNSLT